MLFIFFRALFTTFTAQNQYVMQAYVAAFTDQLREALTIGTNAQLNASSDPINHVVITGLGGSGIGGTIVSQLVAAEASVPFTVNKDYSLPGFVNGQTLVIACSYSGNTEETLSALEAAQAQGAQIAAVTSGGQLLELAQAKGYNHIVIPGGYPPRAAFAFSFTQLFFLLEHYGLIGDAFRGQLQGAIKLLDEEQEDIREMAAKVTEQCHQRIPVLYSDDAYEGVAVRWRQQINENSKMLCWHHAYPEMNHNELVGWTQIDDRLSVVFLRNETDFVRTQKRMDITRKIYEKYTPHITEVWSMGESDLERALYLIHLGDWVSVQLADKRGIDPVEVNVITGLKNELARL
ncbi:MAG: bifunctional phosphoglucose/phosphomannose isomerase [Bacteroidota bacterium]